MQETIYKCDGCKKVIGNKKHISLPLQHHNQHQGISLPPVPGKSGWKVVMQSSVQGFKHFCNGKCIGGYFDKLIESAK